ncbi:MAG: hypothetical protein QNK37_26160 [Acidobacteriota bacterium]|nr:hypothetical protein [Acidobacteriota bacterium]
MHLEEAFTFLQNHQPLPDQPDDELIRQYKAATLFFYNHPDPRCIPLLLGASGLFDDITLYDSLSSTLSRYSHEEVVVHLADACASPYPSVRFAAADVAMQYPDPILIEPLSILLREGVAIIRLAAASALEQIGGDEVRELARVAIVTEKDQDIYEVLEAILGR